MPWREYTEGTVPEEETEAKPLMDEKEDEGCKGCSKLRLEPGAGEVLGCEVKF